MAHAIKSARHGISPDASYILLCYLASEKRDYRALEEYATEAVSLDPLYPPSHSFLAEADLAAGDSAGTERELTTCLSLSGRPSGHTLRPGGIKDFINSSRQLAERGNDIAARLELIKARIAAADACFGCQVALARAYERCGLYNEAIQAWQRAIAHNSAKADSRDARTHIDALERKIREVP
jgi:tetratricopeptide (TPR) repeat protein